MMFIVFLPAKTGRKTTLITYGPKEWGHVTSNPGMSALLLRRFHQLKSQLSDLVNFEPFVAFVSEVLSQLVEVAII
jgi:hypothetical protein